MRNCGLVQSPAPQTSPTITISANPTNDPRLVDCFESDPTGLYPVINLSAGTTTRLTIQGYRGRLGLQGLNNANKRVEINLAGGQVFLDSSCTLGTVVLDGYGGSIVLNGATCTVESDNYLSPASGSGAFLESDRVLLSTASTNTTTLLTRLTDTRAAALDLLQGVSTRIINIFKGLGREDGITATQLSPGENEGDTGYMRTSDGAVEQTITRNADGSVTIEND